MPVEASQPFKIYNQFSAFFVRVKPLNSPSKLICSLLAHFVNPINDPSPRRIPPSPPAQSDIR